MELGRSLCIGIMKKILMSNSPYLKKELEKNSTFSERTLTFSYKMDYALLYADYPSILLSGYATLTFPETSSTRSEVAANSRTSTLS
jgi:hypothetical protein